MLACSLLQHRRNEYHTLSAEAKTDAYHDITLVMWDVFVEFVNIQNHNLLEWFFVTGLNWIDRLGLENGEAVSSEIDSELRNIAIELDCADILKCLRNYYAEQKLGAEIY
ncbi:hypothetical protein AGMMS49949_05230 [Alphaproteobacteria bacterium]|nr:hypothetical protein AGMMS49949_05230 [Alphaproteobacteria bacterium]GHS97898.1 hypothetical protein AGMMS50296_5210 [Alphaproteobacteria bacterium]